MAELTEKCRTCNKAGQIPKWGWTFACNEEECHYEPFSESYNITATSSNESNEHPSNAHRRVFLNKR